MDEKQGISKAKPIPETITERTVITATAHCANCMGMLHRNQASAEAPWLHISNKSETCAEAMRYGR